MRNADCEVEEKIKDHIADVGNMVLNHNNNHLFLITCKVESTAIRTWINMQRNAYFFRTVLSNNKRLALR